MKLLLAREDIKGDSKDDRGPGKHGKEQEMCSRYCGDTRKGQQEEQTSKPPRRRQRGGSAGANGSHRQITRHKNRRGEQEVHSDRLRDTRKEGKEVQTFDLFGARCNATVERTRRSQCKSLDSVK